MPRCDSKTPFLTHAKYQNGQHEDDHRFFVVVYHNSNHLVVFSQKVKCVAERHTIKSIQ